MTGGKENVHWHYSSLLLLEYTSFFVSSFVKLLAISSILTTLSGINQTRIM